MQTLMQKHITQSIKTLLIALAIGASTLVAFGAWNGDGWQEATGAPTTANTDSPILTDGTTQTKPGDLSLENAMSTATLSADILSVYGTSYFGDDVSVGDAEFGTTDIDAHVTGKVGVNLDQDAAMVSPAVQLHVGGTARVSNLASAANVGATYPARLCVDTDGSLVVCPPPPPLSASISTPVVSNQQHIPQGGGTSNCLADVSVTALATGGNWPYTYTWRVKNNTALTVKINDITVAVGAWYNLGSGETKNFSVFAKDPGDSWNIELTATDQSGTVDVVNQAFGVWTIAGCN